jgi:hypothetical protein
MTAELYVWIWALLLLSIPPTWAYTDPSLVSISVWICLVLIWVVSILMWKRKGSSFIVHLQDNIEPLMSGCANITILYIFFVLAYYNAVGFLCGCRDLVEDIRGKGKPK